MRAITHKLRSFHVLTFAFERKIHNVKLRQSLLAFFLSSWISKCYQPYSKSASWVRVCINILVETYLLICSWVDLSWQIYADWGSCVIFFITFNMQHVVVSGHNRYIKVNMYEISCKRQTTSQSCWMTSKVYDVGDRATCRHARFFLTSQNRPSEIRTTHGSQTRMITNFYGPVTTCGSHLTSAL